MCIYTKTYYIFLIFSLFICLYYIKKTNFYIFLFFKNLYSLQRKAFAKARPVNAVLARFLRAVERLARQYTNDTPISRAVRSVFVKYDVDGSGLIDEQELSAIITDLINGEGGTSKFFKKMFFFFFFLSNF
jgi:hypothetical protein